MANQSSRPGRALLVLFILIIGLSATAFIQGASSIRLGLDLQGGTSVTLQPRVSGNSGKLSAESIDQAVAIIRQRVNSLGVAESEVTATGSGTNKQIVISVPGDTGRRIVELVGQTAELRFRQVLLSGAPAPAAPDTATSTSGLVTEDLKSRFAAFDCTNKSNLQGGGGDDPNSTLISCDRDGTAKYLLAPAKVLGRQVSKASSVLDTQGGGGWMVLLNFSNSGTTDFGKLTQDVVNIPQPQNQVAIELDGLVISAPRIISAITAGNAQITGNFTQQTSSDLANVLKYGALPLAFDRGEVQQVSPTLGKDQLNAGLLAGAIGLGLVLLYSLFFYRGLGLVSVGSLVIAGLLTILSFLVLGKSIGFTLTLAGIAGAIVSIGITADSFIVFFERLRDEVREGKSLRSAVESGWVRARRTIIVADSVSIIAAALLYFFAVGGVRGFAFTLGLTTLIDLIVVFLFTKPLMTVLAGTRFYGGGHALSGLSASRLGARQIVKVSKGGDE
jgi:preprotein translocase subunit SecD